MGTRLFCDGYFHQVLHFLGWKKYDYGVLEKGVSGGGPYRSLSQLLEERTASGGMWLFLTVFKFSVGISSALAQGCSISWKS